MATETYTKDSNLIHNTMKDFFYKKNDIIVVLIILIAAGFLIYNRIGVIMDYPAKLAEQQQAKSQAAREIEDGEALEDAVDAEETEDTDDEESKDKEESDSDQ